MSIKYRIGADPELFLVDDTGNYISAHNIVPGDKKNPVMVMSGFVQVDGLAAEFNVNPASTAEEFQQNIKNVLTELQERVMAKNSSLSLRVSPTADFDKKYFQKLPRKVKLLGCEPDYDAYTGLVNKPPRTKEPFRTGAGHIHVGWVEGESVTDKGHIFDCSQSVKQLDCVLYLNSLLWDNDERRRTLYGGLGSFRPKHYGVEYRPLSNAWVSDPDLHKWVFDATIHSMNMLDSDLNLQKDRMALLLLDKVKKGEQPRKTELLDYHEYLETHFDMPRLPDAYLRMV